MTSEDEDTKRTMAAVLDNVFKEHPVGDDIEKITRDQIQKYICNSLLQYEGLGVGVRKDPNE